MATQHPDTVLEKIAQYLKTGIASVDNPYVPMHPDTSLEQVLSYLAASTAHPGLLNMGKIILMSFAGKNGAGACTAAGLAIGDIVLELVGITTVFGNKAADYEAIITVVDQIQQSAVGDLSANRYLALLYRP